MKAKTVERHSKCLESFFPLIAYPWYNTITPEVTCCQVIACSLCHDPGGVAIPYALPVRESAPLPGFSYIEG